MDWPLVGLTVAVSFFVFLLANDVAALVRVSPAFASRMHSVTFFASLAAIVGLGYLVSSESHAKPCPVKARLR